MGGSRGPAPKPTAIKKLRGNPGRRPLNEDEPQAEPGVPACPEHLDAGAREEWDRLVPILRGMRVLTTADYIGLGCLCQAYATQIRAQKQLSNSGLLFKMEKSGYVQQSPLHAIITAQQTIITTLLREFGLTPSSRTRIAVSKESPVEDEWSEFAAEGKSVAARPN